MGWLNHVSEKKARTSAPAQNSDLFYGGRGPVPGGNGHGKSGERDGVESGPSGGIAGDSSPGRFVRPVFGGGSRFEGSGFLGGVRPGFPGCTGGIRFFFAGAFFRAAVHGSGKLV